MAAPVRISNLEDGKGGAEEEQQAVRRTGLKLTECLIQFLFTLLSLALDTYTSAYAAHRESAYFWLGRRIRLGRPELGEP